MDTISTETNSSDITQTIFTTQYQNATVSPTTTTLTPITLTTTTYTLENPTNPTDKTLIIVLATVIPISVILATVGVILWKRSVLQKSASNNSGQSHDSRKEKKTTADLELGSIGEESAF